MYPYVLWSIANGAKHPGLTYGVCTYGRPSSAVGCMLRLEPDTVVPALAGSLGVSKSGSGPNPADNVQRYTAKPAVAAASMIASSVNPCSRKAPVSFELTETAFELSFKQKSRRSASVAETLAERWRFKRPSI